MARRPFAGTGETVLIGAQGVEAGATVTAYGAEVGGSPVTDLQRPDGTPIPSGLLQADNDGRIAQFLGPPDDTGRLWLDAGKGRFLVVANDLDQQVAALQQTVAAIVIPEPGTTYAGVDAGEV